jgi:SsrA-binding protein
MKERKIIARNKRAFRDYHILDRYEAGISLKGSEVKSIREGRISLKESYARFMDGELFLIDVHISPYSHRGYTTYDPLRERKLLMHKQELRRLKQQVEQKGLTVIPLQFYWLNNIVKVELGLVRGKHLYDKRHEIAKREAEQKMRTQIRRRS